MLRAIVAVALSAVVLGATGDLRLGAVGSADLDAIDDACTYYERRTGPDLAREPVSFVAFLSQTCDAARRSLQDARDRERAAAELLLMRIVLLHQTVSEMNEERAAAAAGLTGIDRMSALTRVTPTGEFLIAHRMGLMHAFDAWLDSGADFSLASYR